MKNGDFWDKITGNYFLLREKMCYNKVRFFIGIRRTLRVVGLTFQFLSEQFIRKYATLASFSRDIRV